VASRVVVLGDGQIQLSAAPQAAQTEIVHEPPDGSLDDLERILSSRPDVAVVSGEGERCFFRASLAIERGVKRVVLRRGALDAAWLDDLAGRAELLGSELLIRGDNERSYQRWQPKRRQTSLEVGAPDAEAWARAIEDARRSPEATGELGLDLGTEDRQRYAASAPLPVDPEVPKLPPRLEDVAFSVGLKPVLYLVLTKAEAEGLESRHPGAHVAVRTTALKIESTTGRREYAGDEVSIHAFISRDPALAERAATLWTEGSSRHVRELGALMGYPECCVTSFAALASRSNNAALIYVTDSRTRALGGGHRTSLNVVVVRIAPFTPCSFGCARGADWSSRVIDGLPGSTPEALRRALSRPVLYFDEARAVVLRPTGERDERGVGFDRAYWVAGALTEDAAMVHARKIWGGFLRGGGFLRVTGDAFELTSPAGEQRRIGRTSLGLGRLLDFQDRDTKA
jgi:hypothetical protein